MEMNALCLIAGIILRCSGCKSGLNDVKQGLPEEESTVELRRDRPAA